MTLQQLKYILTISSTGSMNKAAEQLYVSQPSLTSSVQELEKEIGIKIFNRGGRGVTLTNDGVEFVQYAKQVVVQFDVLSEKYIFKPNIKKKFGVSTQHYSFAVKAFVEMVKDFDTAEYEFAIRETKTAEVINDVATLRSEIGIIYFNDFNRKSLTKLLHSNGLEFTTLTRCYPFVYLWKGHPLAKNEKISFEELEPYPCLSFEQGDNSTFYLAEEILSTSDYPRTIKANDRATMLNLMIGLNGYTLCSGIICEELNGSDYIAVPFEDPTGDTMEIGYIKLKNVMLSPMGEIYIEEIKNYLNIN
ncbi:MAG: LysR family transcriptional regulator [Oscillospiraceae bacterium]|nr:LysR family transcriptional regulator [Oscillospiraceae bacterium]